MKSNLDMITCYFEEKKYQILARKMESIWEQVTLLLRKSKQFVKGARKHSQVTFKFLQQQRNQSIHVSVCPKVKVFSCAVISIMPDKYPVVTHW